MPDFISQRKGIDKVDEQITKLLLSRMELARQIIADKKAAGLQVRNVPREKEIITHVSGLVSLRGTGSAEDLNVKARLVSDVFEGIISASREYGDWCTRIRL